MQVIRDDGSLDPALDPGLSIDRLVDLYKGMVRLASSTTAWRSFSAKGESRFTSGR